MWALHHRNQWPDLDARQEPTDVGRRLDAGGIVLGDPFEVILQSLSATYLQEAWARASQILSRYRAAPGDLSWGWFHPGVTHVTGLERYYPSDFVGWISRELKDIDQEPYFHELDNELAHAQPRLRCTIAWRSLKWAIAPEDYALGLRLIEALCTDEGSDWAPSWILYYPGTSTEVWVRVARAISTLDQEALDQALREAKASYSPLGYRILVRGFAQIVHLPGQQAAIHFPSTPDGS